MEAWLALGGLFAYSLALALRASVWPQANSVVAPLAALTHASLLGELFARHKVCIVCFLTAIVAVGLLVGAWKRKPLAIGAAVLSLFAAAGLSWGFRPCLTLEESLLFRAKGHERLIGENRYVTGKLNVIVLVRHKCPHCESFRNSYEGQLRQEFGDRLVFNYIPLKDNPQGPKVPVIIIGPSLTKSVYVEGLPPYPVLQRAIGRQISQ